MMADPNCPFSLDAVHPSSADELGSLSQARMPRSDDILRSMTDPLNRYYRYPLATAMLPLAMRTDITPNQITLLHVGVAFAASYFIAKGTYADLIIAFFLCELRMILDCFDGVVARAKKMGCPLGRAVDEIGDSIGFLALMAGTAIYLYGHPSPQNQPWLCIVVIPCAAVLAMTHDFFKRRISSAVEDGIDGISVDYVRSYIRSKKSEAGCFSHFSLIFECIQMHLFARPLLQSCRAQADYELGKTKKRPNTPQPCPQVSYIRSFIETRRGKCLRFFVGMTIGDNLLAVLHFSVLTAHLNAGLRIMVAYSILWSAFMFCINWFGFLRPIYGQRTLASPTDP